MSLLNLIQVSRRFGAVTAVDSISLSVERGQFVTLLGPSGCGKTTTLRLIAGFERPDSGSISLKNVVLADTTTFVPPKDRRIGMVFQDYALFPHLNVAENVGFGLTSGRQDRAKRVATLLELVGLPGYDRRMPHELSGGQQQRVALARALAPEPDVLLLDEPFSNLDAALRAQLRSEMRAILRRSGTTCVFVTHSQDEALSLSDLAAVMFQGCIAQVAAPEDLYERPATPEIAAFVGEANLIAGQARGDTAESSLGPVALLNATTGPVTLLVRPEAVRLAAEAGDGVQNHVSATVVWSEYYGHERRVGLALADGTTLTARLAATQSVQANDRVWITVRGPVMAYAP